MEGRGVAEEEKDAPRTKDGEEENEESSESGVAEAETATVCTSSDTEEPRKGHEGSDTEEDAVIDRIISQQLEGNASFVEDRMLRFYAAVLQFRIWVAKPSVEAAIKARAVAMGVLELFVLPGGKLDIGLSPPVHKGLMMVHGKLNAFYQRDAYKSRPPRLAPDIFDRAAKEVRARVRARVDVLFEEKLKASSAFREAAESGADLDEKQDKYEKEEMLLLKSKRMLDALLPPKERKLSASSLTSTSSTIRFEVPRPVSSSDVRGQVEDAFSDWLGGGTMTLRKVISLAHTPEKKMTSVAQMRTAARIESRVSAWAGSQARIADQVDLWSAKEERKPKK